MYGNAFTSTVIYVVKRVYQRRKICGFEADADRSTRSQINKLVPEKDYSNIYYTFLGTNSIILLHKEPSLMGLLSGPNGAQ